MEADPETSGKINTQTSSRLFFNFYSFIPWFLNEDLINSFKSKAPFIDFGIKVQKKKEIIIKKIMHQLLQLSVRILYEHKCYV
jgi:hypothetical protein